MGWTPVTPGRKQSVLSGDRDRARRLGSGRLFAAAAPLNKERQKQKDVNRQHREKNLFESFAPIELWVSD
jgi:hypothetical protein